MLDVRTAAQLLEGEACGHSVLCPGPGHSKGDRSLSVKIDPSAPEGFIVHSFAGDDDMACRDYVRGRLGLQERERPTTAGSRAPGKLGTVVATYDYHDAEGNLVFEVLRYAPKDFRQRRRARPGDDLAKVRDGWIWSVKDTQRVIYRLPDVLEAIAAGRTVYIVEGEKDVDALWAIGIPATCNVGGAKKWRREDSQFLAGADVVIVPDADEPGREHADMVATSLRDVAERVRILNLPGQGKDISDWIAAGGTPDRLQDLAAKVDPSLQGWPAPDMSVIKRNRMSAPPFPLDVLGAAGAWVELSAASKSAPIDYVALDLLVVAAGVIGAKRRVSPWQGWDEPSILWGVSVGEPSANKSPAADPFRDAVRAVEGNANRHWGQRQAEYEAAKKAAEAHRSVWEQELKQAIKTKRPAPPMPDAAIEPKPPTRHRLWAVDCTTEQLARLLGDSPAGLICFRDELAGLLGGFDKYGGSGSDRAFWLEAYGGRSYRYDRVGLKGESIDVPFCAVSLLGGVQPDRLDTMLLSGDDDGLAARPLYAWPDPVPPKRPTRVADRHLLISALQRLHDMPFDIDDDGMLRARVVPLAADAADEFQAWWECKQWDAKLNATGRIAGAIGKLDGVTLRIAQTLEFLSWAWGGANEPEPSTISLSAITNAMRIIDEWVRPTLARVFAEASLPRAQRDAMTVARWLLKHRPEQINAKAARRSAGFPGPKDAKQLDEALEVLVDAKWLRPAGTREGGTSGRLSKDFDVNPSAYQMASA